VVPDNPIIPFIEGEGTGPEIWQVVRPAIDKAVQLAYGGSRKIHWLEIFAGQKARLKYSTTGDLPEETLSAIREYKVVLKGPMNLSPNSDFREMNMLLRRELDLYSAIRPARYLPGLPSPVLHPDKIDMVVFRENTEDVYAGLEFSPENGSDAIHTLLGEFNLLHKVRFPDSTSYTLKPISREGTRRLVRSAIRYAWENRRRSVTLIHKGSVMKQTEGNFRNWGYEVARRDFPDITITREECGGNPPEGKILIDDLDTDLFFGHSLLRPEDFDVLATMNHNGDLISEAVSAQAGITGISAAGNVNFESGVAVFEAVHGTAAKYAGLDKANPMAVIFAAEMALRHIGWSSAADILLTALKKTIGSKHLTYDYARMIPGATEVKCSVFGNLILQNMEKYDSSTSKNRRSRRDNCDIDFR
jgi:isocitrate dehydrogenase